LGLALGQRRTGPSGDSEPPTFYSAPLSTSDANGGEDFFGASGPANFVLEATRGDLLDHVQERGGLRFANAGDDTATTYYPNTPAIFGAPFATGTRTTRTLNGFAAALESRYDNAGNFVNTQGLVSSPGEGPATGAVTITTNAAQN